MPNTSATGGYLAPNPTPAPQPKEGQDLMRFLQQIVAGISGIPGEMVRPRWQVEPPNLPDASVTWASLGITRRVTDTYGAVVHHSEDDGYDELLRHQTLELLVSFYGPNDELRAQVFADGLQIAQNREVLFLNAMGLVDTGEPITVPTLVKSQWQHRVDLPFTIRRQIRRFYPILNLLSAQGNVQGSTGFQVPFIVTNA